jgi:hypothetical protein
MAFLNCQRHSVSKLLGKIVTCPVHWTITFNNLNTYVIHVAGITKDERKKFITSGRRKTSYLQLILFTLYYNNNTSRQLIQPNSKRFYTLLQSRKNIAHENLETKWSENLEMKVIDWQVTRFEFVTSVTYWVV